MLKDAPPRQLGEAVRTVATGESLLAPAVTKRLIERYVRQPPPQSVRRERFAELTDRELEILRLLTRGFSNAEIAQQFYLREATVKTTSPASWPSSASATASKPWSWHTKADSSNQERSPNRNSASRGGL